MSTAGALVGIACGAAIYAAFYLAGLFVLGTALLLSIIASRINSSRGPRIPDDDGSRGAANIVANCGVGTAAALVEIANLGVSTELTALCCVTGIAAGASDTVASELGKAFGGTPRSFPTWRRVAPGTPGAISIVGTVSGIAAAALIAAPAPSLWLLGWGDIIIVTAASTVGAFVESTLATAFERGGEVTNHVLNVSNTAVAAAAALLWAIYS